MPLGLIEGQYAPGDPLCADLITPDLASARRFYGELFGWGFEDVGSHAWAVKGDRLAAGFGAFEALDLPGPRWWLCFAAPDLDDLAGRAGAEGGTLSGVIDLEGIGRAGVLDDPVGAKAVLWQPQGLEPGALGATHGGLVWSELVTDDPQLAARFYSALFDLLLEPADGAVDLVRRELEVPRSVAGMVPAAGFARGVQVGARWLPYFQVDDLAAALGTVTRLGGVVEAERMTASGRATAVLTDPHGAEFAVVSATVGA